MKAIKVKVKVEPFNPMIDACINVLATEWRLLIFRVEIGYTPSLAWGFCFQNKLRIAMSHTVHTSKSTIKVAFFNGCVQFIRKKLARER